MELLFKNARDVKLIFRDDLEKEVKRMDDHCIFFDLGSDWGFSNTCIDSVFNTGERSEPEKIDYKKVKTTFRPPLLPIKPPHWTPPLDKSQGVSRPCPPTYA